MSEQSKGTGRDGLSQMDQDGLAHNARLHEELVVGVDDAPIRMKTRDTLLQKGTPASALTRLFPDLPPVQPDNGSASNQLTSPSWVDSYYEGLEFFYWEPQHLGRKKNPGTALRSRDAVMKHLRGMEVTLNQILKQFFTLASPQATTELFATLFGRRSLDQLVLCGRDIDSEFDLRGAMQPDLLFVSTNHVAAVELKIAARSSIKQILKYGLLGLAAELRTGRPMSHDLLLVGVGPLETMFKDKYKDIRELRKVILAADLEKFLKTAPPHFRTRFYQLERIVKFQEIRYVTYSELTGVLLAQFTSTDNRSPCAHTSRALLDGLLRECRERGLLRDSEATDRQSTRLA